MYQSLLNKISQIKSYYLKLSLLTGEEFNIFKILDLKTEEVRVHSKFLAELLDPSGSHGQGFVFLDLFIKKFNLTPIDYSTCQVRVEKDIGPISKDESEGGRIDIFISDNKGNCIVIENKIFAGDQKKQLIRYYNYCKSSANKFNLLYLNLFGDQPSKCSISHNNLSLNNDSDYLIISYEYDIIDWLDKCRKESALLPTVREGISHYINLIKHLTNQSINITMNNEILNILTSNPHNLKSAKDVVNQFINAKIIVQCDFWESLRQALENRKLIVKGSKDELRNQVSNYYKKNQNSFPGLWIEVYKKEGISIHWGSEATDFAYYGYTIEYEGKGGISNEEKYQKYRKLVFELDQEYKKHAYWLGFKYIKPQLNFRSFTEEVCELVNNEYLNNITNEIADNVHREINLLKEKLESIE